MKRAKQKHRPAGVSSEYVVFLHPESDIYKALRGDAMTEDQRDMVSSGARLLAGELVRFTELRILPDTATTSRRPN